jgi:hypothetical protein
MRTHTRRVFLRTAWGAAALALGAGCGTGKPTAYPVTGKVTVGGKDADGALVCLHPVDGDGPNAVRPLGYVQQDGTFQLTSYKENDGAPAGRYKVTVVWRPKKKTTTEPDGPDFLKGRYADPKASKIEVTVNQGATALDPIKLD